MDNDDVPIVDFDPREIGPDDLVRIKLREAREFVDDHFPYLLASAVALTVAAWHFQIEVPSVPNWLVVGILASIVGGLSAIWTGIRVARFLHSPDVQILAEQNPVNGDLRLRRVHRDTFKEMDVLTHNDKRVGVDYLHEVTVNGRTAYEVDSYDPEHNLAVASWQAGVSNSEIRRDRAQIEHIKTDLEKEADKAIELLANYSNHIREHSSEVANEIIHVAQDVETVDEEDRLFERLSSIVDEQDPTEDLLGDEENGDLDLDEDGVEEVDVDA